MKVFGKAIRWNPVDEAREAERIGYDGVRAIDHFFSGMPPEPTVAVPHSLVTLAAAAVGTERVRLTPTMIAATIRHPAEVAQAIASLDRISGGRAELGLGSGWLRSEHDAMGLALGSPGERVERVLEAASICRQMFHQDGCVDFEGRHFRAHSEATWPATPHVPEVMLGAHGPRMLQAAATVADRIDLLETMADGRPNFQGRHRNDEANLSRRIELARTAAGESGLDPRFSATVNLVVTPTAEARKLARDELAAAARGESSDLDAELLRVIETEDGVLRKFAVLGELQVDRIHVRPADPATRRWLDSAVADIQALP